MSAPSCVAVVGLQWGDEGKGKLVDWLAAKAQHVARFQGGNNAGHTLVIDGQRIILHLIPSGIMQPDTHCYIGPGVVLDCRELDEEIGWLAANKIAVAGRLAISPGCPLIMRHHIELDRVRETSNRIGTTLRGIGPAHEDRIARRAVRLRDVLAGRHAPLVAACVEHANRELVALGAAALDAGAVADEAAESAGRIAEHALDVAGALGSACRRGERILLEGSQGALLDIDQGTYPHVTSSNCIAAASAAGLGVDLRPEPFGIVKAYATRVGNGVFPTEISGAAAAALQAAGEEVGATTGRTRRVGWLDLPALRHALAINGCRHLALTKIDVLAGLAKIKVCTAYRHGGSEHETMIPDSSWLGECEAVYEELDGWESTGDAQSLSKQAEAYVGFIEKHTGVHIDVISIGAERQANIVRQHPFAAAAQ